MMKNFKVSVSQIVYICVCVVMIRIASEKSGDKINFKDFVDFFFK